MNKLLDKIALSGSLQVAVLLVLSSALMQILAQLGYGPASPEYLAFTTGMVGYIIGKRAQGDA
jgi:hypothetical protein